MSAIPLLEPLLVTMQKIDCSHNVGFVSIDSLYPGYDYRILTEAGDTIAADIAETNQQQTFEILSEHLASGCIQKDTVFIPADTIPPQLQIIEMDSIICEHREIRLGSQVDTTVLYQWSSSDGRLIGPTINSVARIDQPGTSDQDSGLHRS